MFYFPQNGESALHAAALFGHLPIVKQLVAAGADITLKNQDSLTSLQVAKQQKYVNVVDYLLEKEHQISLLCKSASMSSKLSSATKTNSSLK